MSGKKKSLGFDLTRIFWSRLDTEWGETLDRSYHLVSSSSSMPFSPFLRVQATNNRLPLIPVSGYRPQTTDFHLSLSQGTGHKQQTSTYPCLRVQATNNRLPLIPISGYRPQTTDFHLSLSQGIGHKQQTSTYPSLRV